MNALPESLVPAIGWALLDFLWQGAVVGVAATLALMALQRARPQARYAVLCMALALCVLLPVAGVMRALQGHATDGSLAAMVAMQPDAAAITTDATALPTTRVRPTGAAPTAWTMRLQAQLPWIVALWAIGAGLLAARLGLGMLWVRRLARAGSRAIDPALQQRFERLVAQLGMRRAIALRCVDGLLAGPVAAGIWRPLVLVPAALVASMPTDLLEALLAHELAHVRRHDYLVNLIQGAAEALLFYHPVTWWLSRRIRIEREQVADDIAASALDDPRRLALALHQLDSIQSDDPVASFAPAAQGGHLMSRIRRLLAAGLVRPQTTPSLLLALPILGLAAACLTVYAHGTPAAAAATTATSSPSVAPAAFAATFPGAALAVTPAVAPIARPTPMPQPTPVPRPAPVMTPAALAAAVTAATQVVHAEARHGDAYAVVHGDKDAINLSGDTRDIPAIERLRRNVHGDFVWVRHDGKTWVVRDPELIAKAGQAWAPAEALGARMEVLGKQMEIPSKQMEELGRRMEALSDEHSPARIEMERVAKQMEGLARQQEIIGRDMEKVGMKMAEAKELQREVLQRQMDTLQVKMQPLTLQMERMSKILEAHSRDIERAQQPMEELSRRMEAASAPMEALGKQMEALGKQEEQLSREADSKVRALIEEALRQGKGVPADSSLQ